jgi:hypothetical protein
MPATKPQFLIVCIMLDNLILPSSIIGEKPEQKYRREPFLQSPNDPYFVCWSHSCLDGVTNSTHYAPLHHCTCIDHISPNRPIPEKNCLNMLIGRQLVDLTTKLAQGFDFNLANTSHCIPIKHCGSVSSSTHISTKTMTSSKLSTDL